MDEYTSYDAVGLAELVRTDQVSPAELLDAALLRAEKVNPQLNAIVADVEPPSSAAENQPFRGVPFLIKDLHQDLAGYPTPGGCRALANTPATTTSTVVQRWIDAGLVVFGKTNTPEFGAKGITESDLYGPARNPWNTDHTPGGSSGGAAAAVAAGIVPAAGASDGGGSIRIPASACGLFGLKPSRGLIPAGPERAEGLGGTATDGVISRSVRDTAALLDVLVGPTDDAPYLAAQPAGRFLDEIGREPGRLRVAVCTASAINPDPHPEAVAAAQNAATLLAELGHDVVELEQQPVDDAALAADFLTTWFVACAQAVEDVKRATGAGDAGFEPDTLLMAAIGRATSPVVFARAIERRHEHTRRLAAFHASTDLLLTPTTAMPPPRIGFFDIPAPLRAGQKAFLATRTAGLLRHTGIVDRLIRENLGWVPYTQLANLTGRPAMTVPLHSTPDGLPIGVQFVGRLGAEPTLLRLAAQLETAAPWADRRPALVG
ncbi:amidase [Cryptosporangium aurantiacum]|uniref:Asp-tRNAAsn/Glu-tRNAGln amidotransferase A subunit n=1 Tax=Cryptosporangium aurantiacum TaxID=134849 RepID=A0A1M7RNS2_9ACTN|nr:amidase [Cryptosporangium aurantiacum]SHN47708.1 Asp-tRNAAsn/Glu-tRNAGln amidotransferase A subunit [Cryptosporangium aurantiacum]